MIFGNEIEKKKHIPILPWPWLTWPLNLRVFRLLVVLEFLADPLAAYEKRKPKLIAKLRKIFKLNDKIKTIVNRVRLKYEQILSIQNKKNWFIGWLKRIILTIGIPFSNYFLFNLNVYNYWIGYIGCKFLFLFAMY